MSSLPSCVSSNFKVLLSYRELKKGVRSMLFKRWYDVDPTVSKAIATLEKMSEDMQVRCADHIISKLKDFDFDIEMSLDDQYNYIMRRWYDKNVKVSHAMEYLKKAPDDIRKQLALEIINYLK